MKKLLLIVSFLAILLSNLFKLDAVKAVDTIQQEECSIGYDAIVRIVDNYNTFRGNGVVYKVDADYMYIITSSTIVSDSLNYGVIFENEEYKKAVVVGEDEENEIAVFKTDKIENYLPACFGNSDYIEKGEIQKIVGYLDKNIAFYNQTTVNFVGDLVSKDGYENIYKNVIDVEIADKLKGVTVFDGYGRVSGIVSSKAEFEGSYVIDSNRVLKIADSIVKSGKYEGNYIKYSLVDYSDLNNDLRTKYNVNGDVTSGVVVVTFKPFAFLFGGLNQGMTIVAVNGVEINSVYEIDKQLLRYTKGSKVCLKVIKSNGKEKYYFVKI